MSTVAPTGTMALAIPYRRITRWLVALALASAIVGVILPAGLGWDFACFYDAGRKAWAGQLQDLYNTGVPIAGQPAQGQMAFWGVPLSSYFYAPLAPLPAPYALIVFKLAGTLALLGALVLLYRHTRRLVDETAPAQDWFAATFALLVLLYQPFWTIYRVGGQTTPIALFLLVVALLCHSRAWFAASVACLVGAIMIKPAFASILLFLMLVSGTRFFLIASGLGVFALALSVGLLGWDIHQEFLLRMREGTTKSTSWVHNSALFVWIENLRLLSDPSPTADSRPPLLSASLAILRLIVAGGFVLLYLAARRQRWSRTARLHCYFLLSLVFCLLSSPTVWDHYLELLFVPLIYVVACEHHYSPPARWIVAAIFLFSMLQNMVLSQWLDAHLVLDNAVELVAMGLLKSAPLLLTAIFLWRHCDELFASYTAPAWNNGA